MKTRNLWLSVVATSLIPFLAQPLVAQETERSRRAQHGRGMMGGDMPEECQRMMSERKQMMSQMHERQETISALVTKMEQAKGDAKIEALADVVSALATQRKQMMERMVEMQPRMMAHMMRHMQMNMNRGGDDATAGCPMMKEMMSKPEGHSESGF